MSLRRREVVALSALALTGCAPTLQRALKPGPQFAGPRLELDAFVSFDGARLGLSQWSPDDEPWAVIAGLHGMDDYANAFHLAAPVWAMQGSRPTPSTSAASAARPSGAYGRGRI